MRLIVENYKREHQIFLNSEEELPVDTALSSAGADLQEALVLQRRRLKRHGLNLVFDGEAINGGKQKGEYVKEWIEDKRKYIFQNGSVSKIYGIVRKTYCVKEDTDAQKKVAFVETKKISLKPYMRKLKEFWDYYFGDIENVKDTLLGGKFVLGGVCLTFALIFLGIGVNYLFNNNRLVESILGWPILCMWAILAIVLIIRNKPGRERNPSDIALLCILQKKPDFSQEKFMAMASGRLKCIYYAESQEEIGSFLGTDISDFLEMHKDVLNCEQTGVLFDNFWVTEDYMYMDVEQKVLLDLHKLNRIEQQEKTVFVRFMKARDSIMSEDFYHDWYVTDVEVQE
ncbi:MAG: hypothetical protein J6A45_01155 [Lachnospiraceae bacterium]|nr:hypothetical protein [Lachnospiraceae bacterium]